MPVTSFGNATPTELLQNPAPAQDPTPDGRPKTGDYDEKVRSYVLNWRNQLKQQRLDKLSIWNECWALYRGQEDHSNKEDWQSKIVLPKAWSTVKQAVNVIKRFLQTSKEPWILEATNPDDPLESLRAEKMGELTKVFLDKAHFVEEFSTGLETGFIMGLGVWKFGWNMLPRTRMRVETRMMPVGSFGGGGMQAPTVPIGGQGQPVLPMGGLPMQLPTSAYSNGSPMGQGAMELQSQQNAQYPTQLPNEAVLPMGALNAPVTGGQPPMSVPQKQVVREEILEGQLFVKAVDPYNFYWLPGSKLNRWVGTIEEIEVNKWELMEMADQGAFDPAVIEKIQPMKIDEVTQQSFLRFGELNRIWSGPNLDAGVVKITEYYGPLVIDGKLTEKYAHVIIANDSIVLRNTTHNCYFRTPPYCGFSPLALPFRTEGMGLVEMTRSIDKALNQIVNLSVDTLVFKLLPIFEFTPEMYENPEDIRTGLTPGKILKRSGLIAPGDSGLKPVEFNDVSAGAIQVAGVLDRAHQEGGLVSELQQSLPRWSGAQTATETEAIQNNQNSFFGSLASDVEQFCIAPMIKMANDFIMQYIDTANDPRIAAILGMDQAILAGISQPELFEMIQGDYNIEVRGLTGQLEKAEMLQNLIQFMNLVGQNPEAWLPWIKQDQLLRRMLEAFRPTIHDIEKIINDPQTAAAQQQAMQQAEQQKQLMALTPTLVEQAHQQRQDAQAAEDSQVDQAIRMRELDIQEKALKQKGSNAK